MLLKTLVALLVTFLAAGEVAQANIFETDRREDLFPVPTELQPIGVLKPVVEDGSWGTAFLVGECHIATGFHVAFPGWQKPGFTPSSEIQSEFHIGRTKDSRENGFEVKTKATPVKWGGYHKETFGGLEGDWAVLELEECLGRSYGTIAIDAPIVAHKERSSTVHMAGFPEDRQSREGISFDLSLERNCRIRDWGPGLLAGFDCALARGASGSPVMEEIDGRFYLVGLASQMMGPLRSEPVVYSSKDAFNLMVSTDAFIAAIREVIQQ
ncbi:MAG: trypsin-like peptidase domain-containing protein [Bdellovibrionales bacterium]|nr:trypsin-like peptidase domain-containing protein [Bdellovibrionales bacterium]